MKTQKLNQNELSVLRACKNEIVDCTACEFGITSNIKVAGMEVNQLKGYLSQLSQKGFITLFDMESNYQKAQVKLTKDGCDYLLSLTTMETEIEQLNEIRDNL